MGKPGDELSDPEPWRGSRKLPWKKFETTLFAFLFLITDFLDKCSLNFCFSIRTDFTGKSMFGNVHIFR